MKKKLVSLLVGGSLVCGFTLGAGAAPALEKITAHLNWGVNFEVDGKSWTPTHVDGHEIAPIIYEDTNYVPVRAVSEALGVAVEWDQKTQTIKIGEGTKQVPITSEGINVKYSSYIFQTTDEQYTWQNGTNYGSGVIVENINSASKDFDLQTKNKYQTLELSFFGIDPEDPIRIKVSGGNKVLKDITLTSNNARDTAKLDIGGIENITVSVQSDPGSKEKVFITGNYR